jgi:hypothetical protein
MTTYQPQPQPAPYYPAPKRNRPIGVTILAILEILTGLGTLLAALGMFAIAALSTNQEIIDQLGPDVPTWLIDTAPALFAALGAIFLIIAIVSFILAWGFLRGKSWARIIGIVFAVISIGMSIVSAVISFSAVGLVSLGFSVIIPVIILLYLMTANVKAWFNQ